MVNFSADASDSPSVRQLGLVNWLGLWTLYKKEVLRFLKVSVQTVLAPAVQTLLFMMVLSLAWGDARGDVLGVSFPTFLGPGLVMMAVINAGFANTSSSLIVSKLQGNAVDFLMPPLSPAEHALGFIGGGVTRGLLVAVAGLVVVFPFANLGLANIAAVVYFAVVAAVMTSAIGLIAGVWAEKFDHLAAVTSFIIVPLSFLSGTFYSISILPSGLQAVAIWNPIFYLIDGFRYGFLGASDAPVWIGVIVSGILSVGLSVAAWLVLKSGWRLRP